MGLKWEKELTESGLPYGLYVREGKGNWRLSDFVVGRVEEEEWLGGIRPGTPLKVAISGNVLPVSSVIEGFRNEILEQKLDFSLVDSEEEADIVMRLEEDRYYLTFPNDTKPLTEQFKPEPTNGRFFYDHFLTTLSHISQWKQFRDAHSQESENDRVKFRIYQLQLSDPEVQVLEGREAVLNMTHDLETQTPRTHLRLEIENTSDQDLYYQVYHVSVMFAINRRGIFDYEGGFIRAGSIESTTIPRRPSKKAPTSKSSGEQFRYLAFDLPEHIRDWEWENYESHLIILTSPESFEVHGLEQDYLKPPQAEPNPNPEGANKEKYIFPIFDEQVQLQSYRLVFNNPLVQDEKKKGAESFEPIDYEVVKPIHEPAIVLAFNNREGLYETFLQEEQTIRKAFQGIVSEGIVSYFPYEFVSEENLLSSLEGHFDSICLLHYFIPHSPASESYQADLTILKNILPRLPNLVLLFLHAQISNQEITNLQSLEACPPFILSLDFNPAGEFGRQFIASFYQRLPAFGPVRTFRETSQNLEFEIFGRKRLPLEFTNFDREKDEFPWKLHVKDPGMSAWNLLAASAHPLLGIPQVPGEFSFPEYPFPGLEPYTNRHAYLYYGRDNYINLIYQLFEDATAPPVILLSGRSGVGKSSLLDAGVLPRLQEGNMDFLYLRPTDGPSLDQLLMESLRAYPGAAESSDLISAWKAAEQAGGVLHLIVDPKIARVSLDPGEDPYGLRVLFNSKDRPQGKLLLCYRDDQHDAVADAMLRLRWKSAHAKLQRPDRQVIMDILTGYEQNTSAQKEWGISFEESLKNIIADNLVVIDEDPILPTFQILMKPWWEDKRRGKSGMADFRNEEYTRRRVEGYSLEQYVEGHLDGIERITDNKDLDIKGILLDLLNFHIDEDGSLLEKELWEFHRRYDKTKEPDVLRRQLIEKGLLRDTGEKTSLIHQVLAKTVKKLYQQSDLPVPRVHRMLDEAMQLAEEDKSHTLDQKQLDLWYTYQNSIRSLTNGELAFIKKSQDKFGGGSFSSTFPYELG